MPKKGKSKAAVRRHIQIGPGAKTYPLPPIALLLVKASA